MDILKLNWMSNQRVKFFLWFLPRAFRQNNNNNKKHSNSIQFNIFMSIKSDKINTKNWWMDCKSVRVLCAFAIWSIIVPLAIFEFISFSIEKKTTNNNTFDHFPIGASCMNFIRWEKKHTRLGDVVCVFGNGGCYTAIRIW